MEATGAGEGGGETQITRNANPTASVFLFDFSHLTIKDRFKKKLHLYWILLALLPIA